MTLVRRVWSGSDQCGLRSVQVWVPAGSGSGLAGVEKTLGQALLGAALNTKL